MCPPSDSRTGRRLLLVGLVAAVVLAGTAGVASAQSSRTGGTVVVETGETVDGFQGFGGTVVVRGTVDGDLEAFAGSVVIAESGRVTGDVSASGGSLTVFGTVDGSVQGSAGSVAVGESAVVGSDLRVAAGDLAVAGTVEGDVEAAVETVRLASTASIGGDLRHARDATLVREEGATVAGSVTAVDDLSVGGGVGGPDLGPVGLLFDVYGVVVTLLFGAVILLAFPGFSGAVAAEVADRPLRSGGIGLAGLVGIPLVLVAVAITVVGIPLTFVGLMVYGLVVVLSVALAQYAVGTWALSLVGVDSRWAGLVAGVLGVALLSRLPVVGGVVNFVVFLLGFGAVLLSLYRGYRGRRNGGEGPNPGATPSTPPAG